MKICPSCASENIYFSKKKSMYCCEDCDHLFDEPSLSRGTRIFFSYGHDQNAIVVGKIKEYLSEKGYDVWIDTSEIPAGKDWRERITNGLIGSNGVLSFLSKHSVRDPGVCLDELKIAICLKHAYVNTILLESASEVDPPSMVKNKQWIDMSDWREVPEAGWDTYFENKMQQLLEELNSDDAVGFHNDLENLAKFLGVSDNTAKAQRLLKNVFVGRKWLTEAVDHWLASDTQDPFVIFGVPGAGKSAFSANLAHYNPDVFASVFFEADHSELQSFDTVVKQLAFKLATRLPDYRAMICNIFETQKRDKIFEKYRGAALFDYLITDPLYCCIDGDREKGLILLDGCDETSADVVDLLIRKASRLPGWVKVLFTSRYDMNMAARFKESNTVNIDPTLEQNISDIKEYFACRLDLNVHGETAGLLAQKSEGSFMYASSFCDAVDEGRMSIDDVSHLPAGLNNYYYAFFKRLFESRKDFLEIRPLLELLCTDSDIIEECLLDCLALDRYDLLDLRLKVKSLVTSEKKIITTGTGRKFRTYKFVHQTIKAWLTDPKLSGEYFIDVSHGYNMLVTWCENVKESRKNEQKLDFGVFSMYPFNAIDWENLTKTDKKELAQLFNDVNGLEKKYQKYRPAIIKRDLSNYTNENYLKWLILGKEYDKAKAVLLASFDAEENSKNMDHSHYTQYYKLFDMWKHADMFPEEYNIDALISKMTEIALFPKRYIVGRFGHRSLQITLLTLSYMMDSGRYKEVFFKLMEAFPFASYFESMASDDGETRDGWDKYYMTRDAAICLKKLDKLGVAIPKKVWNGCQFMKLTYNFKNGKEDEGMFGGESDGILRESALLKDICVIPDLEIQTDTEKIRRQIARYNTTSLRYYLVNSDEEDREFVSNCVKNYADITKACAKAIEKIEKTHLNGSRLKDTERRLAFIRSLAQ